MADWGARPAWCVLDTGFQDGAHLVRAWRAWQHAPHRTPLLHHVALLPAGPDLASAWAGLRAAGLVTASLPAPVCPSEAGMHRLELQDGRVLLTLCIGALLPMLRSLQFVADAVYLGHAHGAKAWDTWTLKALARLCRPGTSLEAQAPLPAPAALLRQTGFAPASDAPGTGWTFAPGWTPGTSRAPWRQPPARPTDCAVVGAGLAGAAVAAALARRGWSVTVLDTAPAPAAGASGLPAGLLVPQVARDAGARSRLSAAGVRLMRQWCRRLLHEGQDWAPSGVRQMSRADPLEQEHWHADGAWVRPAAFVDACLAQPGIRLRAGAGVHRLHRDGNGWALLDATGGPLAGASQVVLAAAGATPALIATLRQDTPGVPFPACQLRPMPPVAGQVSWGWRRAGDAEDFPPTPVNGDGHLLPAVPLGERTAWFAGATYEPPSEPALTEAQAHAQNLERLQRLLPATAQALRADFTDGRVLAWRGQRSTTADRLPGVGPVLQADAPGLWISAGMGSRGLTYAVLCAELLAAQLGAEPWPLEAGLARLLAAGRPALSDHL
jgi:tRNA 5-methylaminomethyl-2-thiouridine biosynthesis bifunctional protein